MVKSFDRLFKCIINENEIKKNNLQIVKGCDRNVYCMDGVVKHTKELTTSRAAAKQYDFRK